MGNGGGGLSGVNVSELALSTKVCIARKLLAMVHPVPLA